ncbi:MAG: A/G-specific adenine glycosylase [Candidatus Binatia bacterium]
MPGEPSAARIRAFQRRLLSWYRVHGRRLPWRRTRDPYRILVSEVMLQQTQVDRVKGYYRRFLSRYPTFAELASSPEPQVREAWDGLGYYARARNLQRTARIVVDEHRGRLPDDLAAMQRLPGIGRYTAGAVLSIAYGKDAAILDTNAARVLQRWVGVRSRRGGKAALQRRLWIIAERMTPSGAAGDFNQAIMDLGATVCRARRPQCTGCPVRAGCAARPALEALLRVAARGAGRMPRRRTRRTARSSRSSSRC